MLTDIRKKIASFIYQEPIKEPELTYNSAEFLRKSLSEMPTAAKTFLASILRGVDLKELINRNAIGCRVMKCDILKADQAIMLSLHRDTNQTVKYSCRINRAFIDELENHGIKVEISILSVRYRLYPDVLQPMHQIAEVYFPGLIFKHSDYPDVLNDYGIHYRTPMSDRKVFIPLRTKILANTLLGNAMLEKE